MIPNHETLNGQLTSIREMSQQSEFEGKRGPETATTARRLTGIARALQGLVDGPFEEMLETISGCEITLENHRQIDAEHERQNRLHEKWEHERAIQLQEIERETEELKAAWDRLESERRQLESRTDSARESVQSTMGVPDQETSTHAEFNQLWSAENPVEAPSQVEDSLPGPAHQGPVAETDDFAFQQLRRELRKHSRRQY